MAFHVRRHPDADAFLERATAWLMRAEAEHNLVLGLAREFAGSGDAYAASIYWATIEADGAVAGCAFRTPPFKLGLTRMPLGALPALAEDVGAVYETLPAVLGPEPEVRTFAALWEQRTGARGAPGTRQRIYQLDAVLPPVSPPPGALRRAQPADQDLAAAWLAAFEAEAGVHSGDAQALAAKLIGRQALYFWEDGEPMTMAGWTGRTPNGARVGYVYTPPAARRRGYATACVAALSQHLLEGGLAFCFLYTDLANPTSNSIYQQIGYRPLCDVLDYDFAPAG